MLLIVPGVGSSKENDMKRMLFVALVVLLAVAGQWWIGGKGAHANAPNQAPANNTAATAAAPVPEHSSVDQDAPYLEACAREGLNQSECVGRLIWYKATAGNDRFHSYTFQQRIGVLIDWYRVLRADQRDDRFSAWGIINDPSCCKPGDPNCPAKGLDETYGFDWCPGDDVLLKYVGKSGYVDPACGLKDTPLDSSDPHTQGGKLDQRQSACDLKFGTSTGALGIRKFPNPRFEAKKWRETNGGKLAGWEGFDQKMLRKTNIPSDARVSKLADASVEPPFLIGTACGSCHIAFDPLNPPAIPAHPKWENIKGLIGNQYTRMGELLGSGMDKTSLEWQMFAHARPGVTDTSAISHDQVNNPGTINAIINLAQRPTFDGEQIVKWRKVASCAAGAPEETCWCEPGRDNKCWEKSAKKEDHIHRLLKGGEDSIGKLEAIQRVYFNIGSCSEQCWVNHLTDFRQLDPEQRGFGQTPFNIGQCRRDCPNFRAIEDRLPNLFDFLKSAESNATDLHVAREHERNAKDPSASYTRDDLVEDLNKEFGAGAVKRGREVFAENCARCHSSIPEDGKSGPFKNRDFYALADNGLRRDFLGNDQATRVSEVGTFRCRALHSNHMAGHLYYEYGSETMRSRQPDPNVREIHDGGRSYYRNISLLNLWASAPFMHNNAIGPELCGKPKNAENEFHRGRYVDASGKPLAQQPDCFAFDPSVEGRFKLYKQSMHELLHPKERVPKMTLTNDDVVVDLGLRTWDGKQEKSLFGVEGVTIPKGIPVGFLGNLQHKQFILDLYLAEKDFKQLEDKRGKEVAAQVRAAAKQILANPTQMPQAFVKVLSDKRDLIRDVYSSCTADVEDEGHRFGEDLPEQDKKALTAFLATL
jgi:hypothetical protein